MQVTSIEHLKELAKDGRDFAITLNGGLQSTKYIKWDGRKFHIENYIDSSAQCLPEKKLNEYTNIIRAIEKGALIYEE